mmetsp:Transcript_59395/g.165864  ORF Transcript_59395/g.165864 Transcript_59395/m.165864 type:complete len:95 (+) Transcript_59395:102-386(+)|eukprot:CAMPEP_0117546134 /NCGR_PEP_ID=MMETSP0784-20121206/46452_1 /TAXON_ID=39447 /ORGANISM="" /LENGTH=94 /DNA_ID=CAMNT_0005342999 /DNA_START=102 /DNA_END=386 /DNA_ORIENTATION=+
MPPKSSEGASAPANRAAAATVGGSRTTLARRSTGRAGTVAAQGSGRKAGGGGILNFYTDDAPGLKVGPTTVLVLSLVFMAIVCSLHIAGKFRGS